MGQQTAFAPIPPRTARPARLVLAPQRMALANIALGEPLVRDLLSPATALPKDEAERQVRYMRDLVFFMNKSGHPPDTERIEVNREAVVVAGNHRVLAAWLLRWTHIECLRCGHRAGWRLPLEEEKRKPLEELLGLNELRNEITALATRRCE